MIGKHCVGSATTVLAALTLVLSTNQASQAQALKVSVENLAPADGFFVTPVWFGLHDGSFDLFDSGSAASSELELVAEDGILGPLQTLFDGPMRRQGVLANPAGFGDAPVIDPGETATALVALTNPAAYRYFSYASMVIPSNDAFIGNDSSTLFELFDAGGNFNGDVSFDLSAANIWDAGTEDNDTMGAAFSAVGGTATDTLGGTIQVHPGLDNFLGTDTAAQTTLGTLPGSTPFVRFHITVVPEPASMALVGVAVAVVSSRRRWRKLA